MYFVYLIKSKSNNTKTYIGLTKDLDRRIKEHNEGKSKYTKSNLPWKLEVYIAFYTKEKAGNFEKYLKQGSGFAFAKKHFWNF